MFKYVSTLAISVAFWATLSDDFAMWHIFPLWAMYLGIFTLTDDVINKLRL